MHPKNSQSQSLRFQIANLKSQLLPLKAHILKNNQSRLKFLISLENFILARKCQSRPSDFPAKDKALMGGSLEIFSLMKISIPKGDLKIFQSLGPY